MPSKAKRARKCSPADRLRKERRVFDRCLVLRNERDLHQSVVRFVDDFYGHLEVPMFTEHGAMQSTDQARLAAWLRGYCRGSPDLVLCVASSRHSGLALEFKTPAEASATPSSSQARFHAALRRQRYRVLTTRSYEEAVLAIAEHMRDALAA